jgi:hypothetical protein
MWNNKNWKLTNAKIPKIKLYIAEGRLEFGKFLPDFEN